MADQPSGVDDTKTVPTDHFDLEQPPILALVKQPSVIDEVEEKVASVWTTLRDKPTADDIKWAEQEKQLYNGQLLTSRAEILAWYLYDWANAPMTNVMVNLTMPLLLTALATQYACESEAEHGCDIDNELIEESGELRVYMGAWSLKPTAFTFIMISLSGSLQAVASITIGALADYSYYQFYLFRICAMIASLMTVAFIFVSDGSLWLFTGWWMAFQIMFFGLSFIFYNAYLPQIVENHWMVRRALRDRAPTEKVCHVKQQLADDISQYGVVCGLVGALGMSIVTAMVFALTSTTTYEQLTVLGSTSGGVQYREEWLKPVQSVHMRFDADGNLRQMQLMYADMSVAGGVYGQQLSAEPLQNFSVQDGDYIAQIAVWSHSDDDASIQALQFSTTNGVVSPIYSGDVTLASSAHIEPDQIAVASESEFIFAGYVVYVRDETVTGMDVAMLNKATGQFPSMRGYHIAALLVVLWWNIFQIVCFIYLQRRDGPALPADSKLYSFGARQCWDAIKQAKVYPNMFRFLIAYFCFSDGLSTLWTVGILFATTELGVTTTEAAIMLLFILLSGSLGGVFWIWVQRKIGWNAKQMLLINVAFLAALSTFSMIGLIPGAPFGLVSKPEMWGFAIIFGLNFGSIISYARSVFAELVPVGRESQMFALYEIMNKARSGWIGPLIVSFITNIGSIRWGMFYVTTILFLSAPLVHFYVDLEQGMKQAGRWTEVMKTNPPTNKDITPGV